MAANLQSIPLIFLATGLIGVLAPGCHGASAGPAAAPALATTPAPSALAPAPADSAGAEPDAVILPRGGEDVLAQARELNSDRYAPPPSQFRAGRVWPRQLAAKAVRKTDRGFEVQLPSGAPVTTPTVYRETVLVSGGFHSKEFYALTAKEGKLVWALNLDDDGPSASACDDGICVFNTESCTIFAVEAATGKLLWAWWLGDPLMSAPTIAKGRVFTSYPARGGHHAPAIQQAPVPAGHLDTGQLAPPAGAPGAPSKASPPLPHPPGASHVLAAFDLKTGAILWQRWIDSDVMSAPVAHGRLLYATSFAGTLYAFDQQEGTILAARAAKATSAPVVTQGSVYYTRRHDQDGEVRETIAYCKAGGDGPSQTYSKPAPYLSRKVQKATKYDAQASQWDAANGFSAGAPASAKAGVAASLVGQGSVSSLQAFQGSRLLSLGGLNINTMGDEVLATDARGRKRWSYKLSGDVHRAGGFLAAPPIAAGGRILVGTLQGKVLSVSPKTGKPLATYAVGAPIRSQPVVHDGWIYVGTDDGKLVAIDTGNPEITGWPTWGRDAARTGAM